MSNPLITTLNQYLQRDSTELKGYFPFIEFERSIESLRSLLALRMRILISFD